MKSLIRFFYIVTLLVSSQGYSQKINYKDVIGTWHNSDTTKQKLSFKFIDTSYLIIQEGNSKSNRFDYKLITDSIKKGDIIVIKNDTNGSNTYNYSIELINKSVLRLVSLDTYDPIAISPSEINKGIIYLIKGK
jgi:hypothetical protein